MYTVNPD